MSDTRIPSIVASAPDDEPAESLASDSTPDTFTTWIPVTTAAPGPQPTYGIQGLDGSYVAPGTYVFQTPERPELYGEQGLRPTTIPYVYPRPPPIQGLATIPRTERSWTATQRVETQGENGYSHVQILRPAHLSMNPIREPRLPGSVSNNFGRQSLTPTEEALERLHISPAPDTPTPAVDRFFRPMEKVARLDPSARVPKQVTPSVPSTLSEEQVSNMLNGFSKDYKGKNTIRNQSANIPNSENCSVFIVGLPPALTTNRLLAHVRGVGRIYATVINSPDPKKEHYCSAAKIVFFEKTAAIKFHGKCEKEGFHIDGYDARVVWNRVKSAEQPGNKTRTRVLQIVGPSHFVNSASLTAYFHLKLEFQVDEVLMIAQSEDNTVLEYRFGSYRCQAEAAKMALEREFGDSVKVYFGADPCDVVAPPQ